MLPEVAFNSLQMSGHFNVAARRLQTPTAFILTCRTCSTVYVVMREKEREREKKKFWVQDVVRHSCNPFSRWPIRRAVLKNTEHSFVPLKVY